jgi:hypothetical protein
MGNTFLGFMLLLSRAISTNTSKNFANLIRGVFGYEPMEETLPITGKLSNLFNLK